MVYKVKKINPVTALKAGIGVGGAIGVVTGFLTMLTQIARSFLNAIYQEELYLIFSGVLSAFFYFILVCVSTAIVSGIVAWVYSFAYNIVSKYLGELEIELE